MVWHWYMADDELGRRVGDGNGIGLDEVKHLEPLATQTLSAAELQRAANLGDNGPREVSGLEMTHAVPNEHAAVGQDAELVPGD
jgi:catalase